MQGQPDGFEYGFRLGDPLVVPKSQDTEALLRQPRIPGFVVMRLVGMLTAIKFDDTIFSKANKVSDVWTQGGLAPEFEPSKALGAKLLPKLLLKQSLPGAQFAGSPREP
jgi:hypothetical protein